MFVARELFIITNTVFLAFQLLRGRAQCNRECVAVRNHVFYVYEYFTSVNQVTVTGRGTFA
jgi:hypothetical protein